jgi:phosphoribosyl-ATP pyrophosphohydrolase
MVRSFKNSGTEDIFNGENTRAARKTCPESLWKVAARKLDQLDSVSHSTNLVCHLGIVLRHYQVTAKDNIASESMSNIAVVLSGQI